MSLSFNASGVASTTFQYADVGNMLLSATFTGSGSDAGLSMTGSDAFIAGPKDFAFSSITAAPIKAGDSFSATLKALNNAGAATPNFGKESTPEGVTLSFAKYQPTGGGAVNGSFSGTFGAFSGGTASGSNFKWSEVGTIDLIATLASGSYLGSALTATGSTGSAGAVGRFIPHHFDTVVSEGACVDGFTYSGQSLTLTVTAMNGLATPSITLNYDGSVGTTPNFSKFVTLSEVNSVDGSLAPTNIAGDVFIAGAASAAPTFTFTSVKTAPATIKLRAIDTDGVSSATATEGTASIRSGRLRMQNAYGSELLTLPVPLEAQYWAGSFYATNTADSCTVIPMASVTMGNYLKQLNACETQIETVGNVALVAGRLPGTGLVLTRPGPNNGGSVALAINVGAVPADNTCIAAAQSAATAANMPWFGPNQASRATFGIYRAPIIYRRENY